MGPFIKDKNTTSKMMKNLLIALTPIIIFTFIKNGLIPYVKGYTDFIGLIYPLIFILIGTLSTFTFETMYCLIFKKSNIKDILKNNYSIFPGLFLTLIIPLNTPILLLIMASFASSIIGKMIFGGFGKNILNPALVGGLLIIVLYPVVLGGNINYLNKYEVDTISSGTPLTNANAQSGLGNYNSLIKPYGDMSDFLIGTIPGAVGETSTLLCIVAFIYLTIKKVIKWKIPVTYITTVLALTYVIGISNDLGLWYPLFQLMSGGIMFGAVFMTTDPVTTPVTPIGQILYGMFLGILTIIFRFLTPFPEGVLISILIMNFTTRLLDYIGATARFDFKKALIPFLIAWTLIITLCLIIPSKYENITDENFKVLKKETKSNKTEYIVSQKGYSGPIKASITIEKGEITKLEILECDDSFYKKVEQTDFIKNLKKSSDIDTVSGATITSNALKNLRKNTINDYNSKTEDVQGTEPVKKKTFEILSKTNINETDIEYIVTSKGFSGNIKLQVIVSNNMITTINVLEQQDSYFHILEEQNYITQIIDNQNNINELDTVSGATFSSNGVKTAIINIINDLNAQ